MKTSAKKINEVERQEICRSSLSFWESGNRAPWISRVFDALGLVFISVSIVLLIVAFAVEETRFYMVLFISLLGSGLLYAAIGELLRSTAETAVNTAQLLRLKELELNNCHKKE